MYKINENKKQRKKQNKKPKEKSKNKKSFSYETFYKSIQQK